MLQIKDGVVHTPAANSRPLTSTLAINHAISAAHLLPVCNCAFWEWINKPADEERLAFLHIFILNETMKKVRFSQK